MRKINGEQVDYYPDKIIFFICIPIISAINYYLTYSVIKFNSFLLLSYSIDTIQGYFAWYIVRRIIIFLDYSIPFTNGLTKRLSVQLIATTFAGISFIALTTELVSWIFKGRPAAISFYSIDLLIISIWFLVINGVYVGIIFYKEWEKNQDQIAKTNDSALGMLVKQGKKQVLVKFDDIYLFYIEQDYVILKTINNMKFILDQSLDKIELTLPVNSFFRLNRQYIIHKQIVNSFQSIENGKLLVKLNQQIENYPDINVSRTKAPKFKKWLAHSN